MSVAKEEINHLLNMLDLNDDFSIWPINPLDDVNMQMGAQRRYDEKSQPHILFLSSANTQNESVTVSVAGFCYSRKMIAAAG